MTRRELLEGVGRTGGVGALRAALSALGGAAGAASVAVAAGGAGGRSDFWLDGGSGRGTKVLILGAGLAGLCAAYELGRAGYDCRVLEARDRPGGRCYTVRRGSADEEEPRGGGDAPRQLCRFAEGEYLNAGPARIPQHHVTLDYCRELGVAVEPFCQGNEAAYYHVSLPGGAAPLGGGPVRAREIHADVLGYTSELLAKALDRGALDAEVSPADRQAVLAALADLGELGGDRAYRGGQARGRTVAASAGEYPTARTGSPLPLADLLAAVPRDPWREEHEMPRQPTLFQVVGGMDRLPRALAERLGARVTYSAPVREIRPEPDRVRVVYGPKDRPRIAEADYCVSTLPVPVLRQFAGALSPAVRAAVASAGYGTAGKCGLEFRRRFWEEDDRIFGGITRTDPPCLQIWYPSCGFLGRRGVLVGYYHFDAAARTMGALPAAARVEAALAQGTRVHGENYRSEFASGFAVAWERMPYSRGAWGEGDVPALHAPDGRIFFASADITPLNGWMAGAFASARATARALHARAQQDRRRRKPERDGEGA